MERMRDSDLAQCVSLGGWLRGTASVTSVISKDYTSDSAELLNPGKVIPLLSRCAEYGKMHVRKGLLPFPELPRF